MTKTIRLKSLPSLPERSEDQNDRLVKAHQKKLVRIQQALLFTGERAVVVFEGMDAAGKGGTIRRLAWAMDPRSLKVWPIGAPNEIEAKQHYLQRFWTRMPEKTQIAVFDRSWYGRVLVERVEKLTPRKDWQRAYREINEFERQLVRSGVRVFKFWFSVSRAEQRRRFKERRAHPLKQWKLSPVDMASLDKWDDYTRAKEAMFVQCDTSDAPWTVIKSDCKKRARLNAMRYLLHRMPYTNADRAGIGAVDPLIVGRPSLVPGAGDDQLAGRET